MLITEFEWDEDNVSHLGIKGIWPEDGDAMLRGRITTTKNKRRAAGEYRFEGRGRGGRPMVLVVTGTALPGVWRPVTGLWLR